MNFAAGQNDSCSGDRTKLRSDCRTDKGAKITQTPTSTVGAPTQEHVTAPSRSKSNSIPAAQTPPQPVSRPEFAASDALKDLDSDISDNSTVLGMQEVAPKPVHLVVLLICCEQKLLLIEVKYSWETPVLPLGGSTVFSILGDMLRQLGISSLAMPTLLGQVTVPGSAGYKTTSYYGLGIL